MKKNPVTFDSFPNIVHNLCKEKIANYFYPSYEKLTIFIIRILLIFSYQVRKTEPQVSPPPKPLKTILSARPNIPF